MFSVILRKSWNLCRLVSPLPPLGSRRENTDSVFIWGLLQLYPRCSQTGVKVTALSSLQQWMCVWGFVQRHPRCSQLTWVIFSRDFSTPSSPLQTALTFFVFGFRSSDFYTVRITSGWNAQKWYPCVYFRNRGGGTPPPFWHSGKVGFSKRSTFQKNWYPAYISPITK